MNTDLLVENDGSEITTSEIEPPKVEVYEIEPTGIEDEETVVVPDALESSEDEISQSNRKWLKRTLRELFRKMWNILRMRYLKLK